MKSIVLTAIAWCMLAGASTGVAQDRAEVELMSMPEAPKAKGEKASPDARTCRCLGWECIGEPEPLCWCINWTCYDLPIRGW